MEDLKHAYTAESSKKVSCDMVREFPPARRGFRMLPSDLNTSWPCLNNMDMMWADPYCSECLDTHLLRWYKIIIRSVIVFFYG